MTENAAFALLVQTFRLTSQVRFRGLRFYAEAELVKQSVTVQIYTSTLKIEYQDTELADLTRWSGRRITNTSKRERTRASSRQVIGRRS